jgi:hypothetical protein
MDVWDMSLLILSEEHRASIFRIEEASTTLTTYAVDFTKIQALNYQKV